MFKLYPPFLNVSEESSFSDSWEDLCCKLLRLERNTDKINRFMAPDQGIDIFDGASKTAFQCKSVESGKSGDFKVANSIVSIQSALSAQGNIGWKEYVLCTNVNITGGAAAKLREALPGIIIYDKDYWRALCDKYAQFVEEHFRLLVSVPKHREVGILEKKFAKSYSKDLVDKLRNNSFHIFLYSNRYDKVFRVYVSRDFLIEDLLRVLMSFFELPESKLIESKGIRVSLRHSIVFEGKKQIFSKTIQEVGIKPGSLITYWTQMIWQNVIASRQMESDSMHMLVLSDLSRYTKSPQVRAREVMSDFTDDIKKAFDTFVNALDEGI